MTTGGTPIAAVIIGRNEGARLSEALASFSDTDGQVVYVDSGSDDGSVALAQAAGAEVVSLDMSQPFTAARARNAGVDRLVQSGLAAGYIHFMDGDCRLQPGWLETATAFLDENTDVAAVCGRRREKFPEVSVYNRLIDIEWDTPVGEAMACGGDALMRLSAFQEVGGFNPSLIAGEEPDLCFRMRQNGWKIWRLDAEMTLHDASLTRIGQWWKRARRAGHTYAEGVALHGSSPERYNKAQLKRALIWGFGLPLAIIAGLFITGWALLLAGLWGVKILRLKTKGYDLAHAFYLTLGNIAEAQGAVDYYIRRLSGRKRGLIEYK